MGMAWQIPRVRRAPSTEKNQSMIQAPALSIVAFMPLRPSQSPLHGCGYRPSAHICRNTPVQAHGRFVYEQQMRIHTRGTTFVFRQAARHLACKRRAKRANQRHPYADRSARPSPATLPTPRPSSAVSNELSLLVCEGEYCRVLPSVRSISTSRISSSGFLRRTGQAVKSRCRPNSIVRSQT